MPRSSSCWRYYRKSSATTACCVLCKRDIRYCGSTSNLRDHIKRKHHSAFLTISANGERTYGSRLKKSVVKNAPQPRPIKVRDPPLTSFHISQMPSTSAASAAKTHVKLPQPGVIRLVPIPQLSQEQHKQDVKNVTLTGAMPVGAALPIGDKVPLPGQPQVQQLHQLHLISFPQGSQVGHKLVLVPSVAVNPTPPPPPQEVCLKWNAYNNNMQTMFPSLLYNEQFVDVTLAVEGRSIKCHKVILSSCSSYFEELLSENPCKHPIILMKDLKFWEVQGLVEFMYSGEVNVSEDKLASFLAAAEALQIKGLTNSPQNGSSSGTTYSYANSKLSEKASSVNSVSESQPLVTKIDLKTKQSNPSSPKHKTQKSSKLRNYLTRKPSEEDLTVEEVVVLSPNSANLGHFSADVQSDHIDPPTDPSLLQIKKENGSPASISHNDLSSSITQEFSVVNIKSENCPEVELSDPTKTPYASNFVIIKEEVPSSPVAQNFNHEDSPMEECRPISPNVKPEDDPPVEAETDYMDLADSVIKETKSSSVNTPKMSIVSSHLESVPKKRKRQKTERK